MIEAFSARTHGEIDAVPPKRFRAEHGRGPDPGELRRLKLERTAAARPWSRAATCSRRGEDRGGHDFHAPQPDRSATGDAAEHDREQARLRAPGRA